MNLQRAKEILGTTEIDYESGKHICTEELLQAFTYLTQLCEEQKQELAMSAEGFRMMDEMRAEAVVEKEAAESALTRHAEEKKLMVAQMAGLDAELSQSREEVVVRRNCPECGSTSVVTFNTDEDWCTGCNAKFPGESTNELTTLRADLAAALERVEEQEEEIGHIRELLADAYAEVKPYHMSDCATSNSPMETPGACNCAAPSADSIDYILAKISDVAGQPSHCLHCEEVWEVVSGIQKAKRGAVETIQRIAGGQVDRLVSTIEKLVQESAATLERVGELEFAWTLLEKVTQERDQLKKKSTTWREARDAIYAENKQLKRERDEFQECYRLAMVSVNDAYDKGIKRGFEDCREAAVGAVESCRIHLNTNVDSAIKAIRALTVPVKETK